MTLADVVFQCNNDYLNRAFNGDTYAYKFSVPPALHGYDIPYTFYNGNSSSVSNETVALALQDYITSFTQNGSPDSSVGPVLGRYGKQERILNLGLSNITAGHDDTANRRCRFWQNVPYYQPS